MRIAILGLGAMGSRMAKRLLQAGFTVAVYNRSSSPIDELVRAGAIDGKTPRMAAQGAEMVIAMVRDDEASRAIWCDERDGAAIGLGSAAIAIESSTLTPRWVKELASGIRATGAAFLDAPVVGSRPQADAGQLIHLVGGDEKVFEHARKVFSSLGGAAHHVGPIGCGSTLKLVVNTLFGTQVAVLAELLALLRCSGGDPAALAEILSSLPVTSPAAKGALALMLKQLDAPLFPIDLVEKDFAYTLAHAGMACSELPLTRAAHGLFAKAKAEGLEKLNITALGRLYQPP
jgi:3-hydroxyisobutyrate dehydrogenase-like beta-hydroxyacid dehydrogenase